MKLLRVITIGCLAILLSVSVASAANWEWMDSLSGIGGGEWVEWKDQKTTWDSWNSLDYSTTTDSLQTSQTINVDNNIKQFGLRASRRLGVHSGNVLLSLNVSALGSFVTSLADGDNSLSAAGFQFTLNVDDENHKFSKMWVAQNGEDTNLDYSDTWNVVLGAGEHTIFVECLLGGTSFPEAGQTAPVTAALESFKVVASVTPTPIPGAVWLLGSGLVGLIGLRRKTKELS